MKALHLELEFQNADYHRLETAWRSIVQKHTLLQRVVEQSHLVPVDEVADQLTLIDLSLEPEKTISQTQDQLRELALTTELSGKQYPWFNATATRYDSGNIRLYFSFAADMINGEQIHYLTRELLALYQHPELALSTLQLERPDTFTQANYSADTLRYQHLVGTLNHQTLSELRQQSHEHHIALPVVLLNTFQRELELQGFEYPINMTLANRYALYPYMYDKALFATSVTSLPINADRTGSIVEQCEHIAKQLRDCSVNDKTESLRQLLTFSEHDLHYALFNCSIEQDLPNGPLFAKLPDVIYTNVSMPTPYVDFSVWEQNGQLMYRWSYAKALPDINPAMEKSVLQQAVAEQPELAEILHGKEIAQKKKLGSLKAVGLVLTAGAIASQAHGSPAETNHAMNTSAQQYAPALQTLASNPKAWTQKKAAPTPVTGVTPEEHAQYQKAMQKIPASAPIAALGGAIAALKQADLRPPATPTPPAPEDVAQMSAKETKQAYDNYSAQVQKIHSTPSQADLAKKNLCPLFSATAHGLGTNITKVDGELNNMGQQLDSFNSSLSSGDAKGAASGLEGLTGAHIKLVNKMDAKGLLDNTQKEPLVAHSEALYQAAQNVQEPAQLKNLDTHVSKLTDAVSTAEQNATPANAQKWASQQKLVKETQDKANNSPVIKSAKAKATSLQAHVEKFSQYDCQTLANNASKQQVAELNQKAQELKTQIPAPPKNPASAQIDEVKQKAAAVQQRAQQLQQMPNFDPSTAINDPDLQSKITAMNNKANELAQKIHSHCPICSSMMSGKLPPVPGCGHDHSNVMALTNPFHTPQLNIAGAQQSLQGLQMPNHPDMTAVTGKLADLQGRLSALDPSQTMAAGSALGSMSSGNPYQMMFSIVDMAINSVKSKSQQLADCPNYKEQFTNQITGQKETVASNVVSTLSTLTATKALLAGYMQDDGSNVSDKMGDLNSNMQDSLQQGKENAKSTAQQQFEQGLSMAQADAMGKITACSSCLQNLDISGPEKAKPDEIIVSGFQLQCPNSIPGLPMTITSLPNSMSVNGKNALLINGMPLTQTFGSCTKTGAPPKPCVTTIFATGGAQSTTLGFPIATSSKTKFICPLGTQLQLVNTGQEPAEPVTTS